MTSSSTEKEPANLTPQQSVLIQELAGTFSRMIDLDKLVPVVIERSRQVLDYESAAILLLDETANELYIPYVADAKPDIVERLLAVRFPADRGIAGWVLSHGEIEYVPDVSQDKRWYSEVDSQSGAVTDSLLCAPLRSGQRSLGVIELRNSLRSSFTDQDRGLLAALADTIATAVENAQRYGNALASARRLQDENLVLHRQLARQNGFGEIVGTSDAMQEVYTLMESAIASPVSVLIHGETGTGKELIARAIHYNSGRREKAFVAVNCGALTETLLESELFGHVRGAFTGADRDKRGLFEVADGGTIFLDEVGDMPLAMQAKLLRVLQEGEVTPVGASVSKTVDVRVISATHRDINPESEDNEFRSDLFYRLNVFPIEVPPLRARREDIPIIAQRLLEQTTKHFGKNIPGFSQSVLEIFSNYEWPGNVRQLGNEIERAVAIAPSGQEIEANHLSKPLSQPNAIAPTPSTDEAADRIPTQPLRAARDAFERSYIGRVLAEHDGNATRAAKTLEISRVMLQHKIRDYGLRKK